MKEYKNILLYSSITKCIVFYMLRQNDFLCRATKWRRPMILTKKMTMLRWERRLLLTKKVTTTENIAQFLQFNGQMPGDLLSHTIQACLFHPSLNSNM